MGGPDMAPHTPPPAPRSSWGLDRVMAPQPLGGGSSGPGEAGAPLDVARLLEDGLELELAADWRVGLHHLEAVHRVVVDVTVLVEAPLPIDAVEVLRGRDGLAHDLALLL